MAVGRLGWKDEVGKGAVWSADELARTVGLVGAIEAARLRVVRRRGVDASVLERLVLAGFWAGARTVREMLESAQTC